MYVRIYVCMVVCVCMYVRIYVCMVVCACMYGNFLFCFDAMTLCTFRVRFVYIFVDEFTLLITHPNFRTLTSLVQLHYFQVYPIFVVEVRKYCICIYVFCF